VLHLQNGIINMPNEEHHQSSWHRDLPYQNWTSSEPLACNVFYCLDNFNNVPKKLITMTPVANRNYPINSNDVELTNNSSGVACELNLIDDPFKDCKIISKEFGRNVRNIYLFKFIKLISDFMNMYLPSVITKKIIQNINKEVDINFSNVPGPKDPLFYDGHKLLEIIPFSTPGFTHSFIGIFSYYGHFRTMICLDKNLDLDPQVISDYLTNELNDILVRHEKNTNYEKEIYKM
jgi:hypothetical protein